MGNSTIHYDYTEHKTEYSGYNLFRNPNAIIDDITLLRIKNKIEHLNPDKNFVTEKTIKYKDVVGDEYYVVHTKTSNEKNNFYIFSQQINKDLEYEIGGDFSTNQSLDEYEGLEDIDCCCFDQESGWSLYPIISFTNKCRNKLICSISIHTGLCKK